MQDSAHPTRFFGGDAMSLTLRTYGTRAAVCDPGGIEHAQRAILFGASLLWRERGPLPTTQRAVSLGEKVQASQASSSCCMCPVRWTEG
jgi:hypothetical protein